MSVPNAAGGIPSELLQMKKGRPGPSDATAGIVQVCQNNPRFPARFAFAFRGPLRVPERIKLPHRPVISQ
jgi:hypothetical protein